MLFGREMEQAEIDGLLSAATSRHSGALHISGEPGIGKSALLEYAAEQAGPIRVLRVTGVESEAELPYAALHLLLRPMLDHIDRLSDQHAGALKGALGLAAGVPVDRFLIGLAALTLLDELAGTEPLLCLVDDAQWLDRASADTLLFVARRLQHEGVVLIFASRPGFAAPGVPELRLGDLDREAAARLLDRHAPTLPGHARDRVLAEAAGNPLALLELPRITADPLSMTRLPLPYRIQQAYQQRIAELPTAARTLLAVAAAEESGSIDVVLRVAAAMELPASGLDEAEQTGLIDLARGVVTFRHPLIRTAAYQATPYTQRMALHHALARALDGVDEADRRAWHLAAAATGPDDVVAAALESAAERARERSGFGAAASALARAAHLTKDAPEQGRRLVAAAQAAAQAGQGALAATLAGQADRLLTDPRLRSDLAFLRSRLAFDSGSLRASCDLLLQAADELAPLDGEAAAAMLARTYKVVFYAGRTDWARQALERFDALPGATRHPARTLIAGSERMLAGAFHEGIPLYRAIHAAATAPAAPADLRADAASHAIVIGDFTAARELALAFSQECRTAGTIGRVPMALAQLSVADLYLGRYAESAAAANEGLRIAEDTGQLHRLAHQYGVLAWIAAIEGDEPRCRILAQRNLAHFIAEQVATGASWGTWALAMLDLGLGRWQAALDRLDEAARGPLGSQVTAVYFAPDQVEAAVRLGRPDAAAGAFDRFRRWAEATELPWALAVLARCRALLAPDEEAVELFEVAVRATGRPFEQARAELLRGEWLRRAQRKKHEARAPLRRAVDLFEQLGASLWADRARAELRAAGERAAPATAASTPAAQLTAQEMQVVRLAAAGATNKEIAAQLFLSPKTVGHHLYRAFPKLGVTSRTELAHLDLQA
ncbi:LuxR C-terminal-related transcriptional regulator [Nonomuraea sp. NPDC005501]|uniref:ATP-binding protein n=1 Tax=Nonomuraea sp. NPDC005501 TaxID=3156884 RepID=UPI0033A0DCF7